MHAHDSPGTGGFSPPLVGLVLGACAGLPLYLWQQSAEIGVASFIIAGYTGWLWAHAHNHAAMQGLLHAELVRLDVNRPFRRLVRMLSDPGFWWTMIFGGSVMSCSVWYAGLKQPLVLAGLSGVWMMIAAALSFGLTIIHPVTRCRRCGYELGGQLAADPQASTIRCPECNARWSRSHLSGPPLTRDWRKAA